MFNLDVKQFPFLQTGETIELTYDSRWPECYRFILTGANGQLWRIRMLPLWMTFDQVVKWLEVEDATYNIHAPYVTNRDKHGYHPLPIL